GELLERGHDRVSRDPEIGGKGARRREARSRLDPPVEDPLAKRAVELAVERQARPVIGREGAENRPRTWHWHPGKHGSGPFDRAKFQPRLPGRQRRPAMSETTSEGVIETTAGRTTLGPTERTRVHRLPQRAAYDRAVIHSILDAGLVAHVGFIDRQHPF